MRTAAKIIGRGEARWDCLRADGSPTGRACYTFGARTESGKIFQVPEPAAGLTPAGRALKP